jgi:hypothetical protein
VLPFLPALDDVVMAMSILWWEIFATVGMIQKPTSRTYGTRSYSTGRTMMMDDG